MDTPTLALAVAFFVAGLAHVPLLLDRSRGVRACAALALVLCAVGLAALGLIR